MLPELCRVESPTSGSKERSLINYLLMRSVLLCGEFLLPKIFCAVQLSFRGRKKYHLLEGTTLPFRKWIVQIRLWYNMSPLVGVISQCHYFGLQICYFKHDKVHCIYVITIFFFRALVDGDDKLVRLKSAKSTSVDVNYIYTITDFCTEDFDCCMLCYLSRIHM